MKRILLIAGIGFIVIALVIVVITLLAQRPTTTTTKPNKGPAALTIWRYQDDEQIFKPLIAEFLAERPDVKIEYVKKDPANYEADSANALASGNGPDIWSIPNDWLARHRDKLIAAPENFLRKDKNDKRSNQKIVAETYAPVVDQEVTTDNKVYGLPLYVDTLALYIASGEVNRLVNDLANNQENVDEALFSPGPQTWDELVKFVKTLTLRDKDNVKRSVVAMGTGSNIAASADLLATIMIQNRTQMVSPDGLTSGFNLPAKKATGATFNPGKEALDFYTSFANPAKETFTWTTNFPQAKDAFLGGKTLMVFGYSDFAKTIGQSQPDFNYKIVPFPQISGAKQAVDFASYAVETVTKNAENPELAWQFVKFLATTGLRDYLAATDRPSPLQVQDVPPTVQDRINFGSPFRFQQQTAVSWNRGKDPDAVEQAFSQMVDDIVKKGVPSQQALDGGAKQITEILRLAAGFEPPAVEDKK